MENWARTNPNGPKIRLKIVQQNSNKRLTKPNKCCIISKNKKRGEMITMEEKAYEIYTDASFDHQTKIGTYAIVIMQRGKVIKTIARRCNAQLEKSTECEIFAIFQAINVISSNFLDTNKIQKFWLRTDCSIALDFFVNENNHFKIFENNEKMADMIKNVYKNMCKKLSKKGCSFKLKWVPRGANKIAHKYSYSIFQKLKKTNDSRDVIVIDKKSFIEILKKFNKNQCDVILYLFDISNEKNLIVNTQNEIAESLQISSSTINSIFQGLIKLSMLARIQNGVYSLLV